MAGTATWITPLDTSGTGMRVAVKDAIDVEGVPTTAGCAAVADTAEPAEKDAACLNGVRAARARIVGKANLHELCFGTTGINHWFGTPVNPQDPARVPGGSSSGSAVAVATDEADIGIGTDTGGSVRLPAACCGVAGLKTTWGRIPLDGVWPLAPSLDTVGPLARDIVGVVDGMRLLEPGFEPAASPPTAVGRVRIAGVDPELDGAVDRALAHAELDVIYIDIGGWDAAIEAFAVIIGHEAWTAEGELVERAPDRVGPVVRERLQRSANVTAEQYDAAFDAQQGWKDTLRAAFDRVEVLALPTIVEWPAPVALGNDASVPNRLCAPFNLAGVPALAIPLPASAQRSQLAASLQLVAPWHGEETLCAIGSVVEAAVR